MKGESAIKCINTSITSSQNGNLDSVKALAHNTGFLLCQKMVKMFEKGGIKRAILADLSKAIDCIFHEILIAKLAA